MKTDIFSRHDVIFVEPLYTGTDISRDYQMSLYSGSCYVKSRNSRFTRLSIPCHRKRQHHKKSFSSFQDKHFPGKSQFRIFFLCFNLAFVGVLFNLFQVIFLFHFFTDFFAALFHKLSLKCRQQVFLFLAIPLFTTIVPQVSCCQV